MKRDESLILGGNEPLPRFEGTGCRLCKYFHGTEKGSCDAYPNGIPDKFAVRNNRGELILHTDIEEGQIGKFTLRSVQSHT